MTNRQKIEQWCETNGITVYDLTFLGNSYWQLEARPHESVPVQTYDTSNGDSIDEGIELMFKAIEYDMDNIQLLCHRYKMR